MPSLLPSNFIVWGSLHNKRSWRKRPTRSIKSFSQVLGIQQTVVGCFSRNIYSCASGVLRTDREGSHLTARGKQAPAGKLRQRSRSLWVCATYYGEQRATLIHGTFRRSPLVTSKNGLLGDAPSEYQDTHAGFHKVMPRCWNEARLLGVVCAKSGLHLRSMPTPSQPSQDSVIVAS